VPHRFFARRLHIVMGKGGVGRSTISAAIAKAGALQGKRVLVCELKTSERMSALFEAQPVGDEIRPLAEGVYGVNMTPESALREVALMKLKLRALYRLTFENRLVSDFLRGIPGLPELLMLGKCAYHVGEQDADGLRPRWDMVVVDAPATGHGIPLLRIPRVILELFGESPITHEASQIQALLEDPERTALHLVTLPEELPTSEALELRALLQGTLGLPLGSFFVNQVLLPLLDVSQMAELYRVRQGLEPGSDPALRALVATGESWCRRMGQQRPYIDRVFEVAGADAIFMPRLFTRSFGQRAVERLAEHLLRRLARRGDSA